MFIRSKHDHVPLSFRRILEHSAIHGFLQTGEGNYARIKPEEMAWIVSTEAAFNASVVAARDGIPFEVGQKVRFNKGILKDLFADIVRIDNGERIVVQSSLFGRATLVTVPPSEISAI